MTILNTDLDGVFDVFEVQFERLRGVRKSGGWPTDLAHRVALHEWLQDGRDALVIALVTATPDASPDAPGKARRPRRRKRPSSEPL